MAAAKTNTEKLAAKPDAALREIIEGVQLDALRTQSEAIHYLTAAEHDGIDAGDVVEIRAAPDPAMRAQPGVALPPPTADVEGFLLEQDGELYRCIPDRGAGDGSFEWRKVSPRYRDLIVAPDSDGRVRVFAGAAGEQAGTITVDPRMAIADRGLRDE